jgi:hypothetical protein
VVTHEPYVDFSCIGCDRMRLRGSYALDCMPGDCEKHWLSVLHILRWYAKDGQHLLDIQRAVNGATNL